jgi:hypothetical protein
MVRENVYAWPLARVDKIIEIGQQKRDKNYEFRCILRSTKCLYGVRHIYTSE